MEDSELGQIPIIDENDSPEQRAEKERIIQEKIEAVETGDDDA